MRATNGNGGSTAKGHQKGKARGKGKNSKGSQPLTSDNVAENLHEDTVQQILHSLPEAALMRQQPQLDQSEWTTRVCHWQQLSSQGGVCICPKIHIASVLRQVGWTKEPTGLITSECPDALGLKGYPRSEIFCTFFIMADGAERKPVQVRKWLTQIGFGKEATQILSGPTVQLYTTMRPLIIKFSPHRDWPLQKIPANIVVEELSKVISEHAIAEVQPRETLSASFLCRVNSVDDLLRSSGQRGIYIKPKKGTSEDMELLWLGEHHDLQSALKVSESAKEGFGLAQKGPITALRYAVRFKSYEAMIKFAETIDLQETAALGRFKLSGVDSTVGEHGILAFLVGEKWQSVEVLYFGEFHAVFLASAIGSYGPMKYVHQGTLRQLQFSALNSAAKALVKAYHTTTATSSAAPATAFGSRRESKKAFLSGVLAHPPSAKRNVSGRKLVILLRPKSLQSNSHSLGVCNSSCQKQCACMFFKIAEICYMGYQW